MSEYVPKVGDKVRATLGETVIVGRISRTRSINGALCQVDVVPSEDSFAKLTLEFGHWQFEQVASVPTKFGAVIRRADGLFAFLGDMDATRAQWWNPVAGWLFEESVTRGGFTVLFEGVDE